MVSLVYARNGLVALWIDPPPSGAKRDERKDVQLLSRWHEVGDRDGGCGQCEAYEQAGGRYTEAAKRLGVHPNYLHRLIRNLNLKEDLRKGASGR